VERIPGRSEIIGPDEMEIRAVQDLGDLTRYSINADVPFNSESGDGLVPGLSNGNSSINIRGIEGNRVLLTLDGIRQPPSFIADSFDQSANGPGGTGRDFFDPALFEGVRFVKGAALSRFGSGALGGSVDLSSPDPSDFLDRESGMLQERLRYFSQNNEWNSVTTGAAQAHGFRALLRYSGRVGEETRNKGKTLPNPSDFQSHAALAKLDQIFSEAQVIQLGFEIFRRDVETEVDSAENTSLSNDRVFTDASRERIRWSIRHEWTPVAGTSLIEGLQTQLFYQTTESEQFTLQQGSVTTGAGTRILLRDREQTNIHEVDIIGLNIFSGMKWMGGILDQSLAFGLNASASRVVNTFERVDFVPTTIRQNQMGFAPSGTWRFGAFVENELKLGPGRHWALTPGLRVDHYRVEPEQTSNYLDRLDQIETNLGAFIEPAEAYANTSISPSLTLSWQGDEAVQWWATYSGTVRNPTVEELSLIFVHGGGTFFVLPNPELEAESSQSIESGIGGNHVWARWSANGFFTSYSDFIDPSIPGLQQAENVGEVTTYGFEVEAEISLGFLHPPLEGAYLGFATGTTIGENTTEDQPLNSVDPWKSVAWLRFDETSGGRYGGRLTGTYVNGKNDIDQTVETAPLTPSSAYFVLDLSAYWQLSGHISLTGGINNLLDRQYTKWSTLRRAVGHGNVVTDRLSEPGRNYFLSLVAQF
jgi:hemoglobin/transferrin/lactoferrin receptor protein